MKFLCAIEAVNLDNLFSDCQDLSTTRGGGLAVLDIAKEVGRALGCEPITSGSSQGLLPIEGISVADVEQRVRQELAKLELMEHATIMVAACERNNGDFDQQVAGLKARMRWSQMQSPSVVYPPLHGNLVCDIDGVRPALARHDLEKKRNQSDFTYGRRQLGRKRRRALPQELLAGSIPDEFDVVDHLQELAGGKGRFGNLENKIAVLRFDGNDFGKVAARCTTEQMLRAFSDTTRQQQAGFFRSLFLLGDREGWFTDHDPPKLRLEIMVYGGDEVTFITPAWLGWKALLAFYREAREWKPLQLAKEERLTYSAGVVFCHHNAPIHAIKQLASGLADQAKDRAVAEFKEKGGGKGNFAVYQILESFDSVGQDLDEFMKERSTHTGNRGVFLGLGEIEKLEENMEYWRTTLSRRKLHQIVREIMRGEDVEVEAAINELVESKSAAPKKAADTLRELRAVLGNAAFVHILELWDYAGVTL